MGRRPYNDIVIDNLAVSGEHAVLQMSGNEVYLEDLNSTNGTYVNGKAVKKLLLQNSDTVEIGKYKIKYVNEAQPAGFEKTMIIKAGSAGLVAPPPGGAPAAAPADPGGNISAAIKVMSGAAAGREVALVKVVTTIGKPGVAVAAITQAASGICRGPCGRGRKTDPQRCAHWGRARCPEKRRHARTGRNADAVRPTLTRVPAGASP